MLRILALMVLAVCSSTFPMLEAVGQIMQPPGTDYFVVEAELFDMSDDGDFFNDEFTGWIIVNGDAPQDMLLEGLDDELAVPFGEWNPTGGTAIIDQSGGGDFADTISYPLSFSTPGTYYLYLRYSMFDLRSVLINDYGNDDSIYLPVESLDEDPTNDDLRSSRDGFVDLGDGIDGEGLPWLPSDGCRDIDEPWFIPEDVCIADGLKGDDQFEGRFHWQPATWNNELGQANYEIVDTGTVIDFAVASREAGSTLDVFLFSQNPDLTEEELDALIAGGDSFDFDGDGSFGLGDIDALSAQVRAGTNDSAFDVTADGLVDFDDIKAFVEDPATIGSWIGDANLDGEFNSADFVEAFQAGQYEDEVVGNSTWATGDWTGDGEFDSADFVAAFQSGGFEQGPRQAASAVPEPVTTAAALLGFTLVVLRFRQP